MFIKSVGKPTTFKKAIYLLAATVLGVMLSFMLHAFVEIMYLRWLASREISATFYNGCALHPMLQLVFLALGLFGGLYLGRTWWRLVYVERFWEKK